MECLHDVANNCDCIEKVLMLNSYCSDRIQQIVYGSAYYTYPNCYE